MWHIFFLIMLVSIAHYGRRRATVSLPIAQPSSSAPEPTVDRKGKKKAEPSPPSSPLSAFSEPLSDPPSETEEEAPPAKRLRSSLAGKKLPSEEVEVGNSKGKGKAKAKAVPAKKAKAKMPRKTST